MLWYFINITVVIIVASSYLPMCHNSGWCVWFQYYRNLFRIVCHLCEVLFVL